MTRAFKLQQSTLSAAAQLLDEAAALAEDACAYQRLLRLKEQALACRARGVRRFPCDRRILRQVRALLSSMTRQPDLWDLLRQMERIENALYERERSSTCGDSLAESKRALFTQWRHQAAEIDLWTARKDALVQAGLSLSGHEARINREQFDACARRLDALHRAFHQTWLALRAMDSVLLMQDEEAGLRALEKLYRDKLPDADAFEEDRLRTGLRRDALNRNLEAIAQIEKNYQKIDPARDDALPGALSESEASNPSEQRSDPHDEIPREPSGEGE